MIAAEWLCCLQAAEFLLTAVLSQQDAVTDTQRRLADCGTPSSHADHKATLQHVTGRWTASQASTCTQSTEPATRFTNGRKNPTSVNSRTFLHHFHTLIIFLLTNVLAVSSTVDWFVDGPMSCENMNILNDRTGSSLADVNLQDIRVIFKWMQPTQIDITG